MFFYSGGQSDHDRSGAWAYQGRAKVWGLAETKGDWIKPSSYISLFMSKVVTYWLAKLLEPQHTVVLSDEHQDFQVAYLAWLLTKLDIYRSFFLVGELWDCLPVGGGVPRYAAIASEVSGRPRKRQMIPNKHKMVFTHAIFQSQWLGQQTQQPSIYNRSKDRPKH